MGKMQQSTAISQIVKKLMPELHEKNHFKSATTLGFKLPSTSLFINQF